MSKCFNCYLKFLNTDANCCNTFFPYSHLKKLYRVWFLIHQMKRFVHFFPLTVFSHICYVFFMILLTIRVSKSLIPKNACSVYTCMHLCRYFRTPPKITCMFLVTEPAEFFFSFFDSASLI